MTRMLRAAAVGAAAGAALSAVFGFAFYKGCPIYDHILDHDTLHHL